MPKDMFGDVVDPSVHVGGAKKWYAVPLVLLAHLAIIGALIIVPLMALDALPNPPATLLRFMSVAAAPTPPPPPTPPRQPTEPKPPTGSTNDPPGPPLKPPNGFSDPPERRVAVPGPPGEIPGNDGVPPGVFNSEPPPPPPPVVNEPLKPVIVGGKVQRPQKTRDVAPVYPTIAQSARVQGVVIIEATIGVNGRVLDARILRSIPLLDASALAAVRQWEFTPTFLNGQPVPVIMTVTVNFTLQ